MLLLAHFFFPSVATLGIHPASPAGERRRGGSPRLPALCVPRTKTAPGGGRVGSPVSSEQRGGNGSESNSWRFSNSARGWRCLCCRGVRSCFLSVPILSPAGLALRGRATSCCSCCCRFPPQADGTGAWVAPHPPDPRRELVLPLQYEGGCQPVSLPGCRDRARKGTEGTQRGRARVLASRGVLWRHPLLGTSPPLGQLLCRRGLLQKGPEVKGSDFGAFASVQI